MKMKLLSIFIITILAASNCSLCPPQKSDDDAWMWLALLLLSNNSSKVQNRPDYTAADIFKTLPQPLKNPGKIYIKDNYLLVNERNEGIHIYDNSDRTAPQPLAFIVIPGNTDLAVHSNTLYADSNDDLAAIDISDLNNITVTTWLENILLYRTSSVPFNPNFLDEVDSGGGLCLPDPLDLFGTESRDSSSAMLMAPPLSLGSGQGGSMARFVIVNNHLYAVTNYALNIFDLASPAQPSFIKKVDVAFDLETIYALDGRLFIGAETGMYIYDVTTPDNPTYISQFVHARRCDPVVASGNYAYVTLRGGSGCGAAPSQLEVIDISTITTPVSVKTIPLAEPAGIALDGSKLYVCNGQHGINIYDVSTPTDPVLQSVVSDHNAWDAIALPDYLLVTGSDGLFQYNTVDPLNLSQLSQIVVTP